MRPQQEAGIRIEPPPSAACAKGTTPALTKAAAPPDDPPVEYCVFSGLRVGPFSKVSTAGNKPNSEVVDLPKIQHPLDNICWVIFSFFRAAFGLVALEPCRVGWPSTSIKSLTKVGTPEKNTFRWIGKGSMLKLVKVIMRDSIDHWIYLLGSMDSTFNSLLNTNFFFLNFRSQLGGIHSSQNSSIESSYSIVHIFLFRPNLAIII
jgi:hypothetical protein